MAAALNGYGACVAAPNYGEWWFGTGEWLKLLDEVNDGGREGSEGRVGYNGQFLGD